MYPIIVMPDIVVLIQALDKVIVTVCPTLAQPSPNICPSIQGAAGPTLPYILLI
jgi:hypothetical protein